MIDRQTALMIAAPALIALTVALMYFTLVDFCKAWTNAKEFDDWRIGGYWTGSVVSNALFIIFSWSVAGFVDCLIFGCFK